MNKRPGTSAQPFFLGIEGGATRTSALLAGADGGKAGKSILGPSNLRLLTDAQLVRLLRSVRNARPAPVAVAIGLAGARTEADRERIRRAASKVWPGVPCLATNDLETALMAADDPVAVVYDRRGSTSRSATAMTRVLVLSGTGSCCFARRHDGKTAKVGGWGHILGDKGSGFEIGLRALKAVVYYYDCDGVWSRLGQRLLRKLQLNEPDDLIGWVRTAGKEDVAALAVEVFKAWVDADRIAADILEGAAHGLAKDAVACARRLVKPGTRVQFVLAGGVLLKQPRFARRVGHLLSKLWPNAVVRPLKRDSVWGAVELAKQLADERASRPVAPSRKRVDTRSGAGSPAFPSLESLKLSPTEQRNPRSLELHKMSLAEAIALMLAEDARIPTAILSERKKIEQAVQWIVQSFKKGGRLFYVGAGTSGRLGVLDASECPPTFRTSPELVQGVIAGGQRALWEAVEGAEDDPAAGAGAMRFRGVNHRDVVVGIAASGRTPFVWGALWEAKRHRAKTILLCFNPNLSVRREHRPDLVITPNVGPEILAGSTRLKSGTATKLILNMFTTLAMVRMGKVISNLMVDVNPSNVKLRDRAVRIVCELTGVDGPVAKEALEKSGWVVQKAWLRLRKRR